MAEWLTGVLGRRCRLLRQNPAQRRTSKRTTSRHRTPNEQGPPPSLSLANEAQFLLLARGSLEQLLSEVRQRQSEWTTEMDPIRLASRFRANFVVSGEEMEPYAEETWSRIRIGDDHYFQVRPCAHLVLLCVTPRDLANKN